jgi:hypothetical protein
MNAALVHLPLIRKRVFETLQQERIAYHAIQLRETDREVLQALQRFSTVYPQ